MSEPEWLYVEKRLIDGLVADLNAARGTFVNWELVEDIRADHFQSPHGDCHSCREEVPCDVARLVQILDQIRHG